MESSITFLGTAGDPYVVSKQLRASGGIVIKSDNQQFLVDPGPGSLSKAAEFGINLRENTAIVCTSTSIKGCNDVNAVVQAMTYDGIDIKGVLIANSDMIDGSSIAPPILMPKYKNCVERTIIFDPPKKIGIEHVELFSLPTNSGSEKNFGIKFITNDFCLVYTSDTSFSKSIIENYMKADILILNCLLPSMIRSKEGLCSEDVIKILKIVKPKLAIITGFGKKMLEADPLQEARNIQMESNVQTLAAQDGLIINPYSYSAKTDQKTLFSFDQ